MSNPFSELKGEPKREPEWEEWGGQFSCQKMVENELGRVVPCSGWARVAKYHRAERLLVWECQDGHRSYIEEFDD